MRRRSFLAATLPVLAASSCGYALVGRGGGSIDPTIKRIGVPLFLDRTGKPQIDRKVTDKVIEELLKRGKVDVVSQRDGVDAVVDGGHLLPEYLCHVQFPRYVVSTRIAYGLFIYW